MADDNPNNNTILTIGAPRSVGGVEMNPDQENMMAIGSGLIAVDSAIRDPALNTTLATSISPTANIDTISSTNNSNAVNSHIKGGDPTTAAAAAAASGSKDGSSDATNLNVNTILTEADNAAIAAQTITLAPGTIAGNGTVNNPAVSVNNMNLNQYILASAAGVPPVSLPANAAVSTPAATAFHALNATPGVANPTTIPAATADVHISNGNTNAALQQNAATIQQNAATLQYNLQYNLQHFQQTNKLGMLAPIVNMTNLASTTTTTNPVQLLATAPTTPSLILNNATVGAAAANNAVASALLPTTAATSLQTAIPNLSDLRGAPAIATAPVGAQPQQQQQQQVSIPAQLGTISIAPGAPQIFPVAGVSNNISMRNGGFANTNAGVVNASNNNSSNDAVQNILRTAFMLQNGGLPFLQQGIIPQQQQPLIPPPATAGGIMLVPNSNNNTNTPYGIVSASASTNNSHNSNGINDGSGRSNESNSNTSNVGNTAGGPASGAAAAANAAASVLPPASMNLPLHQQLHQQQQQQQQLNPSLVAPQMGMDLTGGTNSNNAIALLGGAVLNNHTSTANHNGLQIPGLGTLYHHHQQQQQQQRLQAMAFPPMPESLSQHTIPLAAPQPQKTQPSTPGSALNPATTAQLKQQQEAQSQSQRQKKQSTISRPLYLDHDSNCLTAYQCFLRKQIELFEVGHDEMTGTAQGRNTPLHYGQVGIRCRHCAHLPKAARARGGVYYSRTIDGVYQVAQNMSKLHFLKACTLIPENTKNQLKSLQSVSSRASGGKEYWAEGLRVLGIVEEGGMLRFASSTTSTSSSTQVAKSPK